ncbi:cupredoxin domain-containing protein [Guyparkeria halopsychrophila]|uniref:cupredoxin domain-containing protein n=1 Tax=Guyparkeria halopsychrophila TaxID=3139421 RepID=UPI0037C72548
MPRIALPVAIAALLVVGSAQAETRTFDLTIKDHRFQPEAVTIPAGEKVKLMIHNQDATPEEFESYELNREKIIPGNSKAVVYVGPLEPGEYPFFGEFNQATAQGRVIAE